MHNSAIQFPHNLFSFLVKVLLSWLHPCVALLYLRFIGQQCVERSVWLYAANAILHFVLRVAAIYAAAQVSDTRNDAMKNYSW